MSAHSLYAWVKRYSKPQIQRQQVDDQQAELRRLRAELKRVTEERDILKRPPRTLPRSPAEVRRYQQLSVEYPVRRLCQTLQVHPSGYYAGWEPKSARAKEDQRLLGLIKHAWLESGGSTATARSTTTCVSWASPVAGTVARLMRREGLRSQTGYRRRPGYYGGKPPVARPTVWSGSSMSVNRTRSGSPTSLTSARMRAGCTWRWCWICFRAIGWSMKPRMCSDLAIDALLMAVWRRKPKQEVMIHSDQAASSAARTGRVSSRPTT